MIARIILLLVASFILPAGDATKKDLDRMQGEWKPTKVVINGEALKDDFSKDRLTIKGKSFVLKSSGMNLEGTLTLDASKFPPLIDTESPGPDQKTLKTLGIYDFDGETLKVCYTVAPNPRPKAFKSESGSSQALVIYQRVK